MEVNRAELLNTLNKVKPGLATKEIVEEMTHFLFTGTDVISYNDRVCVHHPYETDFKGSVQSSKILETLNKYKTEMVDIVIEKETEDSFMIIKSGKSRVVCAFVEDHKIFEKAESLTTEIGSIDDWLEVPEHFIYGAYLSSFSAGKDASSGTATCIRVEGNLIWCGDQERSSRYELEEEMEDFMIKAALVATIQDYNFTYYYVTKSWVHFIDDDNVTLSARRITGKTLPYDKLFGKFEGTDIDVPEGLKGSIDIASIMSSGDSESDKSVSITIEANVLTCEGRNNTGFSSSECEIEWEGDRIEFHINPVLLLEVMTKASKISVGENASMFHNNQFMHLLAYKV